MLCDCDFYLVMVNPNYATLFVWMTGDIRELVFIKQMENIVFSLLSLE
uniref:Uncharacterized protein n=1 Tax=Rhizophora mucronata TaxID=61149 RepID=A0A2P2IME4_RHIMU